MVLLVWSIVALLAIGIGLDFWKNQGRPDANYFFTISSGCCSAIFLVGVIWMWFVRNRPLSIHLGNRELNYGKKLVCEAGAIRAVEVCLCRDIDGGMDSYVIVLIRGDGQRVELPSPFFASFSSFEKAFFLAATLAEKLQVGVSGPFPYRQ